MIGGIAIANSDVQAQHISVNININSQPAWGPIGYNYVDYYYLPDINVYYIVNSHRFVYFDGRRWITTDYLPSRYRNYDLYGMYKVVLVGGSRTPWIHNKAHYREYGRYRNYRSQSVIRDSRSPQYNYSRNNHYPWYRESNQGRRSSRVEERTINTGRSNNNKFNPSSKDKNRGEIRENRGSNQNKSSRTNQRNDKSNYRTIKGADRK